MKKISSYIDNLSEKDVIKIRTSHWRARLIVSLILLGFSMLGVIIGAFFQNAAWHYWCFMVPIFAIICIWLSWYVSRTHSIRATTIWHEILHWLALLAAVYIVSIIVHNGIVSYLTGALFVLILLALTMFLAGIHFDAMFCLIGILLAILAVCTVYFVKYLVVILIPICLLVGALFIWRYIIKRKDEKFRAKSTI